MDDAHSIVQACQKLQTLITENEITTIDLRIIAQNYSNNLISHYIISYPVSSFEIEKLTNYKYQDDVMLVLSSADIIMDQQLTGALTFKANLYNPFIDLFLAHKTLVLFIHMTKTEESKKLEPINKRNKKLFHYKFHLDTNANNNNLFLQDIYRDVRGEIVAAMIASNIKVMCHFNDNMYQYITVPFSGSFEDYLELKYKMCYIINMIAKTYNIIVHMDADKKLQQLSYKDEVNNFYS